MSTIKDIWIDLFDNSLEIFKNEDNCIRNISMILHICQLEFKKLSKSFLELKHIEIQAKELNNLNNLTCQCKTKLRSPLQAVVENINTQKSDSTSNSSVSYEDSEDIFNNHHLTDLDVNLLKENDNSLFVNDSFDNTKLSTSPTLNSSKRKSRSSRGAKKQNANSIIHATPVLSISKTKKIKRDVLSLSTMAGSSRSNNCSTQCDNKPSTSTSKHKDICADEDDDETLVVDKIRVKDSTVHMDDILDQLCVKLPSPRKKKAKLNNSYDCIPVVHTSPGTPYKQGAVRKRTDRLNMQGWNCPDCEKYYGNMNLSDGEMKRKMDQCSKHRNNFNPNRMTPAGFWDPDFSPTQEESFAFHLG